MKLPTLHDALQSNEGKKKEVESVKVELDALNRISNMSIEQRHRRNYLELLLRTLKNELFSSEMTLAEIQWYGEGA